MTISKEEICVHEWRLISLGEMGDAQAWRGIKRKTKKEIVKRRSLMAAFFNSILFSV